MAVRCPHTPHIYLNPLSVSQLPMCGVQCFVLHVAFLGDCPHMTYIAGALTDPSTDPLAAWTGAPLLVLLALSQRECSSC